jgi:hypothetical protein
MVEPAAVIPPRPPSCAALTTLWMKNSGGKQQCRCANFENPSDDPPGSVAGSLFHRRRLRKTALRVRGAAARRCCLLFDRLSCVISVRRSQIAIADQVAIVM